MADMIFNISSRYRRVHDRCKNKLNKEKFRATTLYHKFSDTSIDMTDETHTGLKINHDIDLTTEAFTYSIMAKAVFNSANASGTVFELTSDTFLEDEINIINTSNCGYGKDENGVIHISAILDDPIWHLVTFVRDKGKDKDGNTSSDYDRLMLFIDGVLSISASILNTEEMDMTEFSFGYDKNSGIRFIGYIDEVYLAKNIAQYTADFPMPTTYTTLVDDKPLRKYNFKASGSASRRDIDTLDILYLNNSFSIANS